MTLSFKLNPQKPKQVFSRKFISKAHIISIYSVKNDGKFETFLWYVIHKMSDRGNYYKKYFEIKMTSSDGKTQTVWEMRCENCLARHDHSERKNPITVECTSLLLNYLLQMMNLSSSVQKTHRSGKMFEIIVSANSYTYDDIPNLIRRMCGRHIYWNISSEDANEIITRLGLSQYVFCVQCDPTSGACLVVLQELGLTYYQRTHQEKKEPRTIFREEYEKINQSRTVVMTRAQRDTLLSEEMKPSVEFSSVLPDGQIEVVFRREAIQTVVPEIKRLVEIENLEQKLKELKMKSK